MVRQPLSAGLRPRPGRRLPSALSAVRIGERVRSHGWSVADPGFQELLAAVDGGAPVHSDNRIALFFDGDAALAAMVGAIESARWELLVESYIFRDDVVGRRFQAALVAACKRRVVVRVLVDAIGSFGTRSSFWKELRAAGVEVRLFHRLLPTFWWHALRDHRKLLIADRRLAFTGGMNIGNEYGYSWRHHREGWRDTQVAVAGEVAVELAAVFSEGWERAGGEPLVEADEAETGWLAQDRERANAGDGRAGDAGMGARVLVQDSRPLRGHRETAAALAAILAAARRRIWITLSYFVPGRLATSVLVATARRRVDVRLLLPGPTDVPLVRHAGHASFAQLLSAGVRIHEYLPAVLHAKTLVADDEVSVIGSSNLDRRSFFWNGECNLVIFDACVTAELAAQFEQDLAESPPIDLEAWRRRGLAHRVGDALAGLARPLL